MNLTISLCMIVKNEDKVLNRCLNSVKDQVDEIILVDTGSTDNTLEIAKHYTDKIYHFDWVDDFAAARNYSISKATGDYILILDADEYFESNANLKKDITEQKDYYIVTIKNLLSNNHAYSHMTVRLFARDAGLLYKNRLHEHLNIEEKEAELVRGELASVLLHTGYNNETMEEKDKKERNFPLMLREVKDNPTGYNLFNMGKIYIGRAEYEEALKYFQRAYPKSSNRMYQPELLNRLAETLEYMNRPKEALKILTDAVELYEEDTDLLNSLAKSYMQQGYYIDAEAILHKCFEIGDKGVAVTEGSGSYLAHFLLSELYEKQGRIMDSYEAILKSIQINNKISATLTKYLNTVSRTGIPENEIQQNIDVIYNINNVEDLKLLIEVLYTIRHPLLQSNIKQYDLNLEENVKSIALQYIGHYEEAKHSWMNIESIKKENAMDVLVLSIILQDMELYKKVKDFMNLSTKEQKIIQSLIDDSIIIKKVGYSTDLEKILLTSAQLLIKVQEYVSFQKVTAHLMQGSVKAKLKLGQLLIDYNFFDAATDVLLNVHNVEPTNAIATGLLGDISYRNNQLDDALFLYQKSIDLSNEYIYFEKLYRVLSKLDEIDQKKQLKNIIENQFPLAKWVRK
ncbi:TPR domain-containing glycosyltransferase [Paenibacillus dauci]|uniref:TPR domain-containing glycosyltransferase n=1 Tax=Paenibacillus dauci TaxID=1567106 RepID=UPI00061983A8|nr:TPR domain-containing glycosyltransferase [Paenibacillus dauci]